MTKGRRVRPPLAWGLAGSVLASALALWWPQAIDGERQNERKLSMSGKTGAESVPTASRWPARAALVYKAEAGGEQSTHGELAAPLSPAERDPFYAEPSRPAASPVSPALIHATPVAATSTSPPAPPQPPQMAHRVMGRFQSPDGAWLTFVQDGELAVLASAGLQLATGWVVESLTEDELRLSHARAEQTIVLPISRDPSR